MPAVAGGNLLNIDIHRNAFHIYNFSVEVEALRLEGLNSCHSDLLTLLSCSSEPLMKFSKGAGELIQRVSSQHMKTQ